MSSFLAGYSIFMALLFGIPGLLGAPVWALWVGAAFGILGLGLTYVAGAEASR